MRLLRPAFTLLILLGLLTGGFYPLLTTGLAQVLFPAQSHGSLIEREGQVIGATLIAQGFHDERYFHPRPSAAGVNGYDAAASSGSNHGPTSKALLASIRDRTTAAQATNPGRPVPLDLVSASGSGLDPHVSPAAALFQLPRVAKARGLDEARLRELVAQHTQGRQLGLLGEPRVNVLQLNLALDAISSATPAP